MKQPELDVIGWGSKDSQLLFKLIRNADKVKLKDRWDNWKEGMVPKPAITPKQLENFDVLKDGFDLIRAAKNGHLEIKHDT